MIMLLELGKVGLKHKVDKGQGLKFGFRKDESTFAILGELLLIEEISAKRTNYQKTRKLLCMLTAWDVKNTSWQNTKLNC